MKDSLLQEQAELRKVGDPSTHLPPVQPLPVLLVLDED